jgi:NAD(P)-dependent dehydrogenase (short-subunit alcohol dehydrogenase family)
MQSEVLEAQMRVNMLAPLLLSQAFAAQLPPECKGNIIILSDGVLGWSISPHFFSYAASKLALNSCTDLLASALAPRVRVNTIALGITMQGQQESNELFERLEVISPLQKNSNPAEVLRTIDYLLGCESITGQIISLASGMNLASKRVAII